MIRVRPMTVDDLAFGMRLKARAGWNQTEADWRRALDLGPGGAFVAEWGGRPVGTVASFHFGPVAWVAMMLVDPEYRRRGIGRALMDRVLGALDGLGVRSVRLDATPDGRPLYESLGFRAEATIVRHAGTLPTDPAPPPPAPRLSDERIDALIDFDRRVTGADRAPLLRRLVAESPDHCRVAIGDGRLRGFALARPGSEAVQLGPCLAEDEGLAVALLDEVRRGLAGHRAFLDVPRDHEAMSRQAGGWGLTPARTLTRMGRGPRVDERLDRLWASAGPETG